MLPRRCPMKEIRMLSTSGILGYGFPEASLAAGMARDPHMIGVELGYDHIAFLIAVVLWARRLWPIVKIVTAFTVAHSITWSLAALNVVVVPSAIIEPAIAASIVFVALENFFSRDIDRRWRDTSGFGLIHGFGFASALQEFGVSRDSLLPAMGAFNGVYRSAAPLHLGVEIGQIAIVSLIVPALILL